jgi:hypothetical protein
MKEKQTNDFNFEIYKKNIFSQYGEDGIIEEIFKRLESVSDKQCCEFGAWDGKFLSNTCNLITNHNYEAILIESDKKKFNELNINFPEKKIIKINKFVNFIGENTLDNILENNFFKKDFDFLSIDIDGCDYYIFEGLSKFTPKVICIEFNPSIPNKVNFIQEKDMKINQGSSAKSLIDLALQKDYFPIASTNCNLFFIHNKFKKFLTNLDKFDIDRLLPNSHDNFIFCGYVLCDPLVKVKMIDTEKQTTFKKGIAQTSIVKWDEQLFLEFEDLKEDQLKKGTIMISIWNKGYFSDTKIG